MSKIIKMYTNGDVRTVEIPENHPSNWFSKQIGCDTIEIVHPRDYQGYILVVDGEGLLKEDLFLNVLASVMYGTHEHGSPILGNALLMQVGIVNGEHDAIGFTDEELEKAYKMLDKVFLIGKGWMMKLKREQKERG